MTKREIKNLIKHNRDTNTYYAHYDDYGFHGTNISAVTEQLNALICHMPGCGNIREKRDGYVAYLCHDHFIAARQRRDAQ
jgi:hypothetical protein